MRSTTTSTRRRPARRATSRGAGSQVTPRVFATGGTEVTLDSSSFSALSPTYIAQPPKSDGWGRFYKYATDAALNHYRIQSGGREGTFSTVVCGTTTDFTDDIGYVDGTFIQWPEGTQQ